MSAVQKGIGNNTKGSKHQLLIDKTEDRQFKLKISVICIQLGLIIGNSMIQFHTHGSLNISICTKSTGPYRTFTENNGTEVNDI